MKDWNGNYNSVIKTLGAHNGIEEARAEHDYYATDPVAIDKLLKVESPSHYIWECAAGEGHLSKRLVEKGYQVFTSDIVARGGVALNKIQDFLTLKSQDVSCIDYDILTNPPYKFAKEFVSKALELIKPGRKVYMFLKLTFLEGKARYKELFSKTPPKTIYVFSERVLCAKNGNFDEFKQSGGSAVAYAWFVWEKGYKGKPTIEWI